MDDVTEMFRKTVSDDHKSNEIENTVLELCVWKSNLKEGN